MWRADASCATRKCTRRASSGAEAVPALIGRGTLKRVEQGSLAAVALRVPIEAPIEAEIDLVVDDGDNPPLDVAGDHGRIRRTALDLLRGP